MSGRQIIAAMAASAAIGGVPTGLASAPERIAWSEAVAAFRLMMRALDEAADDDFDEVSERFSGVAEKMIKTPAPDCPALLFKLEHLFGAESGGSACYCEEWTEAFMADAHRLLWSGGRA